MNNNGSLISSEWVKWMWLFFQAQGRVRHPGSRGGRQRQQVLQGRLQGREEEEEGGGNAFVLFGEAKEEEAQQLNDLAAGSGQGAYNKRGDFYS